MQKYFAEQAKAASAGGPSAGTKKKSAPKDGAGPSAGPPAPNKMYMRTLPAVPYKAGG